MTAFPSRLAPLARVLLFAAVAAAAACGGDGPTDGGGTKVFAVGDVVSGNLGSGAEVDTVRVRSAADADAALYVLALGGGVQATLAAEGGPVVAVAVAAAAGREEPSGVVRLSAGVSYRVLVSAASGSGGGGYRVRVGLVATAPERVPAALVPDAVVEGERLESGTDVDHFTFTGNAGETYVAFIQAGAGSGSVRATVTGPGTPFSLGWADSQGGDAELEAQGTGRFTLAASGEHRVTVAAPPGGAGAYTGDYRLQLRRVNLAPESGPVALAAGDTVTGEAIDYVGDVDEFTLAGTPGDRYNLFFQADPASVRGTLTLEAAAMPTGVEIRRAASDGRQVLLENATGTVTLPASGSYRVRVQGNDDRAVHRGAYRVFAYRADPRPERVPAALALNDSVVGERIELPGDVDEYTVDVPRQMSVVLSITVEDWRGNGSVTAAVGEGTTGGSTFASPERRDGGTHPILLAAGRHTVRVGGGWDEGAGFRSGYRLRVFAISPVPERVPAAFAVGDTVAGEDLRPLGDVDTFTFQAAAGQELNLFLQGTGGSEEGGLYAIVSNAGGGYMRAVLSSFASPSLRARATRFTVPATGSYTVTVYPNNGGYVHADQGAFRFALVAASRAPEHVPAAVTLGATVTGESLDYPSDVDSYTVHGTPGSTMHLSLQMATNNPFVSLVAHDVATGQFLGMVSTAGSSQQQSFTVPPFGTVRLTVLEGFFCPATGSCDFTQTGPYTFSVQ